MKPLSSSGTASRPVEDAGDTGDRVCEGHRARPGCPDGDCSRPSQDSSPVSLPPASLLLPSTATDDSNAPTAYALTGLRRTHPPDYHGRGHGEGDSSHMFSGVPIDGVEDAEDLSSIHNEPSGRAKPNGRCAPGVTNLSPHPLSFQQSLQNQQQRFGKRHDWGQAELSFSSSQIGSLLLTNGSATLPAAGSCTAGGNGGGRLRRSASGVGGSGGDGAAQPSRHLQPPANHSHVNLFVRDLPLELNEEKLRAMFTPFGDIVNSAIMRNIHTGVSLGTAFVRFAKHEEAMQAMEAFAGGRPVTGSKRVTVQWARREHDKAPSGDERRKMRKLFIRNVPKDVTQEMLAALFSQYGPVKSVSTHRDTAAANAVSHPGGGSAAAATETDPASHGGHDSAAAAVSIDDRRIAFVTFEMEGVAEQATAAVHNTMPFASCQGIPLMVKLAEDTPVRHNALSSNSIRSTNAGILNGVGANGNGAHLSHSSSTGSGGSVGGHHPAVVASAPNNNALASSDLSINDYVFTPMTSPPAAQLQSTTGLAMPPGATHGMPLGWGGTPGPGTGRSLPRAPQDGSIGPALSPPRSFAGTTGAVTSTSGTPKCTALSPTQSSSAVLLHAGQAIGSPPPPRQPVQSPTAFSAPPTSASSSIVVPQQMRSCSAADPMVDVSHTLASAGFMRSSSGSCNVQGMCSGPTDPIGFLGGDYSGCFLLSSYEAQELYSRLQQYSSDLAVASGATAQPPLSRQPSAPAPGTSTRPHADSCNNLSSNSASANGPPYQVLGSYTDAAQRDGVTSPLPPQPAQPSSSAPLNSASFQQSTPKVLSLPQPRSGVMQQQQQQPASAESECSNISSGGYAPTPYRLIPQPRSNAGPNLSVPLNRSAAAATAFPAALAPSSATSRRANTLPPGACPPSSAATLQSRAARMALTSTSRFFTAAEGYAHSKSSGTCFRRAAPEEEGVAISGALSLRHGPRATSSSVNTVRGGCNGSGGCSFGANSGGAAPGTSATPVNSELAASFASNTTNTFQPYQGTGIVGCGSAAGHSAHGTMNPRGSSKMKYTAAPSAKPASLPLPLGRSPAPQPSSRRFSDLKRPVTAAVSSPTFTTAPLMAAAAKMLSTDDSSLNPDNTNVWECGAYTSGSMYTAKLNYPTSYAAKVMGAASDGDPPLCGETSGTSGSHVNMSNTQSSSDAVRGRLASTAPAQTASSGGAASAFFRSGHVGDASPRSFSHGGVGLLDSGLLFPWQDTSAAVSGIADSNGRASVATDAAQSSLLCNDAWRRKEPSGVFETISIPSESRAEDLIALTDKPKAASESEMWSQPKAGACWSAVQMRDTAKLVLSRVGSGDTAATAYRTPSTAKSTPKDLSHRSTARALPGVAAQLPSRISRSDDGYEDERGWIVYPDFNLNLGWPLGPGNETKNSGGLVGSGCESGSSHDGVDHLYSQHLGNAMDNLYNLMSYADASF
ncbi:hypothetical protein LSCM4_03592 [Leishmania orientalis]|uniref:RRM domain-containing protein n=1 Tax=Leishmania orientalis TaxID=2249476 RepID=A0A836H1K0_9TRYP|nr:hypothetical protein LSCM4_03592 [Leishmania orientalis]